jgi:hypothetical protein
MRLEHAYWLAALIDGEGSIAIRDRRRPSGRLDVAVVIAQNDVRLLEVARDRAEAGRIYKHVRSHVLRIERAEDVSRVLGEVTPMLIVKRDRAENALAVLDRQGVWVAPRVQGRFVVAVP